MSTYNNLMFLDVRKIRGIVDAVVIRAGELGYDVHEKNIASIQDKGFWFDIETKEQIVFEGQTPHEVNNSEESDKESEYNYNVADLSTFFTKTNWKYRKPKKQVKLTRKYIAEIEDNRVKVGCQYITFDQVKEVYNAVIEQEKENGNERQTV